MRGRGCVLEGGRVEAGRHWKPLEGAGSERALAASSVAACRKGEGGALGMHLGLIAQPWLAPWPTWRSWRSVMRLMPVMPRQRALSTPRKSNGSRACSRAPEAPACISHLKQCKRAARSRSLSQKKKLVRNKDGRAAKRMAKRSENCSALECTSAYQALQGGLGLLYIWHWLASSVRSRRGWLLDPTALPTPPSCHRLADFAGFDTF